MEKKILVAKAARMQCPGNDLFSCWGVEVGCFFFKLGTAYRDTVDGRNPANQLKGFEVGSLSHCLHVSFTSQVVIAGCLPSTVDLRKFA